jgi:hypothetical protein
MRKTESFFGWTMPSRNAIRRAEQAMDPAEQGVRDEIGFLYIHDAYANRFFPGTSVLQTRLRYALFVPWIYRRLFNRGIKRDLEQELTREELILVSRLSQIETRGVIGRRIYPRPTKQPSTFIYWSALAAWGILRDDEGATPSRTFVHRILERTSGVRRRRSEEFETDETYQPFWPLPDPPKTWEALEDSLSFMLSREERKFLREKISIVRKPGTQTMQSSLLANLVRAEITPPESMYSSDIATHADEEDSPALTRARNAAALGAIGRAIYAALVEEVCESYDHREKIGTLHRDYLSNVIVPQFRDEAVQTDLTMLRADVSKMPDKVFRVLDETCNWLQRQRTPVITLRDVYAEAEYSRKVDRARLPSTGLARERRNEWYPSSTKPAEPLHYRWHIAQQFLADLNDNKGQSS